MLSAEKIAELVKIETNGNIGNMFFWSTVGKDTEDNFVDSDFIFTVCNRNICMYQIIIIIIVQNTFFQRKKLTFF